MLDEQLSAACVENCGGKENIKVVMHCMTRLRFTVADDRKIDREALMHVEGVLSVVHDRIGYVEIVLGPGRCARCAKICKQMGAGADAQASSEDQTAQAKHQCFSFKFISDVFVPMIPGIIAAGICAGIVTVIQTFYPNGEGPEAFQLAYQLLNLIKVSIMSYLTAWTGWRAAERFGGTPVLGGMLGMLTSLDGINSIATSLGLYSSQAPASSVLYAGRGGVIAVIVGAYALAKVEKALHKRIPDALDVVFTPTLTLILCSIPYIFLVMPGIGYLSSFICDAVSEISMSEQPLVRMLTGFLLSAIFLPMVAAGMHHGLAALYTVQLERIGYITIYPALAMAGAGQVGAAISLYRHARASGDMQTMTIIRGAVPAGILGIGEPLIYGVTLPKGWPFITAGIGAGFGGAFVMGTQVAATAWGPSGVLGLLVMTEGPLGAIQSSLCYAIGLVIACAMGFVVTELGQKWHAVHVKKPQAQEPTA